MGESKNLRQVSDTLLMIRPARFGFNELTVGDNAFQDEPTAGTEDDIAVKALAEFEGLVSKLRAAGVRVIVVDDPSEGDSPDAVFPNNWFSTHQDGKVILYPMAAENRRKERSVKVFKELAQEHDFRIGLMLDLSANEDRQRYLEGTGSLVLDRQNKVAYACLSVRTDELLLAEYAETFGWESITFIAHDRDGAPIYHTNVMMHVGTEVAAVCFESIPDSRDREKVRTSLSLTGKTVLPLSLDQMYHFAGNMLEVSNKKGQRYTVMSSQALGSLNQGQRQLLENSTMILDTPLDTIERYGGGSARCMLAEVYLPEKDH